MRQKIKGVIDVFLQPGEIYCGDGGTRIRTLLGSCVAITLWHPRQIGAMCHFMLPARRSVAPAAPDARYGDDALAMLLNAMWAAKAPPPDCEIKLFGGGNMFRDDSRKAGVRTLNVAQKNVDAARVLLAAHGLAPSAEDLGGSGHRQLIFDIGSGAVWVKRPPAVVLDNLDSGNRK